MSWWARLQKEGQAPAVSEMAKKKTLPDGLAVRWLAYVTPPQLQKR